MPKMATAIPARKVIGSSLGAAASTILIIVLQKQFDWVIDEQLQVAITTIVVLTTGYFVPAAERDRLAAPTMET